MLLVTAIAVVAYFRVARKETNALSLKNTSIAVLPFTDISPAKDEEYFSDGLAEQLIDDLARVSGLKVVGRSSAFQFKGRNEDLREIGRKLGVANVLEGSVQREGSHVRITANLIKVDDGFQLWSQTYDREVKDIFAIQDEIASAATAALQVKLLGGNGQPLVSNLHSTNPEAYQAYLLAKYLSGQAQSKEDFSKALARTEQAIKLDEKYAPAWALRSSVQAMMAEDDLMNPADGFREARNDAERAIGLDPTLASAYLALATTQIDYDWDWSAADTYLTNAAALEPGSTDVFRTRAHLALALGNVNQAINFEQQAVAIDPLHINSHLGLGYVLYLAGRYDDSQAEMKKALDLDSQSAFVHISMGKILMAEGKPQQALVEIEKEPTDWGKLTGQVLVYHALSREQDSNAALARLISTHATDAAYQIAQGYAYRGESDKSFEWLERAYEQRDAGMTQIKTDPLFKNLRTDPRYTELLQKMRLAS
jgi:TolB-like protein/Tfp pilus assembly protein PilF